MHVSDLVIDLQGPSAARVVLATEWVKTQQARAAEAN